jgi:HSP20 family protein
MAISRRDPFRDLMSIQNELNRLFGRTYGGSEAPARGAEWAPPVDVYETKDRYVVQVELPGVAPEEVEISVEDSTLGISGERNFYQGAAEEDFHRIERHFGSYRRTLTLPRIANVEAIDASFDAGVLSIQIPKREEAKPKKVQVKATA